MNREYYKQIFRKMCLIRYFEFQVCEAVKKNLIPGPVYLSIGQEAISATISTIIKGYAVFAQHRCHSVYLAHGGNPERLVDELLGYETGCCGGKGGSPCIQDLTIPIYGHHGLIGENIPLATGYALAMNKPTVVYFGDAAAEEDYAAASFGFAATHKLPILYICEDNNLSILTPVKDRRSWKVVDIAAGFGLHALDLEDEPEEIIKAVKDISLPALVNIRTCRHYWHVGIGNDGPPARDRLGELRNKIPDVEIETEIRTYIKDLWQKQLQRQ